MTDSEFKKKEISEYPDRRKARLKENSFENIHSPLKETVYAHDFLPK